MARQARRNQKKGGWPSWLKWGVGGILVLLTPALWAVYIVIFAFLLPSAVARFVDKTETGFLTSSVFAVNLCGALLGITALLFSGEFWTGRQFLAVIGDPMYWIAAYGAAAIGWALFIYVPRFIGKYLARKAERRVSHLRRVQERLVQEWGWKVAEAAGVGALDPTDPAAMDLDGAEPMGLGDLEGDGGLDLDKDQGPMDDPALDDMDRNRAPV